jgi:hypothetical protein
LDLTINRGKAFGRDLGKAVGTDLGSSALEQEELLVVVVVVVVASAITAMPTCCALSTHSGKPRTNQLFQRVRTSLFYVQ